MSVCRKLNNMDPFMGFGSMVDASKYALIISNSVPRNFPTTSSQAQHWNQQCYREKRKHENKLERKVLNEIDFFSVEKKKTSSLPAIEQATTHSFLNMKEEDITLRAATE